MKTRDLLGGNLQTEIDLEVGLPPPLLSLSGWERRLDMKSGKVYYGAANSTESSVQDLNFPLTASVEGRERENGSEREKESLEEHDFMGGGNGNGDGDENVEAHLLPIDSSDWQSVCTLDKVKMALQRAHKQTAKRKGGEEALQFYSSCSQAEAAVECPASSLLAAGCPRCLLYVLLPKNNPKCPRCSCSILDISSTAISSSVKRSRLYHKDSIANHESNNASPPFLFDLNTPI